MNLEILKKEIKNELEKLGFELVKFEKTRNKDGLFINIVIDRFEDIDMNAISEVSSKISDLFDSLDLIDEPYFLDISSLGAEKPIEINYLDKYLNRYVCIHLINPIDGENIYYGTLKNVELDYIEITYRIKSKEKLIKIFKNNILKSRLAIKF